mmetsp:Transcript_40576/g.48681  ORF Transcript_40576/g.48681 Transcript_40576/m.48681 type:complete len:318 (-) Transcript_40576:185-1138(-)
MSFDFDLPPKLIDPSQNRYADEAVLAVKLALEAGRNMIPHCNARGTPNATPESSLGIQTKSNEKDLATLVDVANEDLIVAGIKSRFPSHSIIGEEDTGTGDVKPLSTAPGVKTWIIDPIDGTTNFVHGLPLTCVSIGMCDGGIPVLGVVYAPMTHELYVAVKGCGSYRNGVPIRTSTSTSTPTEPSKTLSKAVVCVEFGSITNPLEISQQVEALQRIMVAGIRSIKSFGSGVLDLVYVASGRLDIVYAGIAGEGWKPWDYCAGMVIVEEAGGCIRTIHEEDGCEEDGQGPFDIYSKSMICGAHSDLVEECRALLLNR